MKNLGFWAFGIVLWFFVYQGIDWLFMDIQGLSYAEHIDMFFTAF